MLKTQICVTRPQCVNLLFLISSTCFGRCFRPPSEAPDWIYSIWYCSPKLLPAGVPNELKLSYANCEACIARLTIYIVQFQLPRDTSRQELGWTLPDTVNSVKCSWWWAKTSPETC